MCCGFDECCCCDYDRELYVQCRLKKKDSEQVAWIPKHFAVVGKVLKVRGSDGKMENGWHVLSAGIQDRTGDDIDRITRSQMDIVYRWSRRDTLMRHLQASIDNRYSQRRVRSK